MKRIAVLVGHLKRIAVPVGMVELFAWCLWEGNRLISDPDVYWHIETGRYILAHGWPRVDVFSHTVAGQPWVDMEWLSQVIMALVFDAAGWGGLIVLGACLIVLTWALLFHYLRSFLCQTPSKELTGYRNQGLASEALSGSYPIGSGCKSGKTADTYTSAALAKASGSWPVVVTRGLMRQVTFRSCDAKPITRQADAENGAAGGSGTESSRDSFSPWTALSVASAAILFASFHFLMRPHLFALPILVVWTGELLRGRPIQWWLPPIFLLWVQLHGSFIVGIVLAAGLGYAIAVPFLALAVVGNPYGWGYYEMVYWQFAHMDVMRQTIVELRPVSPYTDMGRVGVLIAALAFMLWRGYKLSLMSSATLCGLLFMALQHWRGLAFFAVVAPLIVAKAQHAKS